MNHLSTYIKVLELEAELQRLALAVQLDAGRRRSDASWLIWPVLGSAASWFIKSRGGWRMGVIWVASRLASYWRQRKLRLT